MVTIRNYVSASGITLLGDVEKYFLEIDQIPGFGHRMKCLSYQYLFPTKLAEIKPNISLLRDASKQLRKSKKFSRVRPKTRTAVT